MNWRARQVARARTLVSGKQADGSACLVALPRTNGPRLAFAGGREGEGFYGLLRQDRVGRGRERGRNSRLLRLEGQPIPRVTSS